MVGDDVECDVAGGRRMGLHTIGMVTPGSAQDAGGADAVLAFLSDVPAAAASLVDKVSAHAA
jgi:predicted HAD superfamily phosphohydrolase YqeG